jgi:hypothetical protein
VRLLGFFISRKDPDVAVAEAFRIGVHAAGRHASGPSLDQTTLWPSSDPPRSRPSGGGHSGP